MKTSNKPAKTSGSYRQGDIVLVQFPYSDQPSNKKRPALVLSEADAYGDVMLMGITSQQHASEIVEISNHDLAQGSLPKTSWLKTSSVSAVHTSRISKVLAHVQPVMLEQARACICPRLGCK